MGQKVNPHGLRVGIIKDWNSKWYADADFADNLVEDYNIRTYLKKRLYNSGVSKIEIERASDRLKVIVYTAKPGVVIGKGGSEIEKVKKEVSKLTSKKLLIDIKDLRAMLNYVGAHAGELRNLYGNIAQQSIGSILRSLLVLEQQGGDKFFGEPAFEINDLFKQDQNGRGVINILASEKLFQTPKLYATFLLWFLSELYENLPEVGDLDKPKLVFFFDEAHVLFGQSNAAVQEKIELIVRLIRSKGISIFFVTQNPTDIPNAIASQLGNRVQHGLRAFTPAEQKNVKAVAETFRQEDGQDLVTVITNLKVGDAVVSTLQEDGSPSFAEVVSIYPPKSKLDAGDPLVRQQLINQSAFYDKYAEMFDRESAHEQLAALDEQFKQEQEAELAQKEAEKQAEVERKEAEKQEALAQKEAERQAKLEEKEREREQKELERQARQAATKRGDSAMDRFTKNVMSSVGREVGRVITRGVMGLFKK